MPNDHDDLTISIVVNTNGRRESLQKTLESFRWLDRARFEVCVVCGPTQDGSQALVADYVRRGWVKSADCAEFNLSVSRNIGIRLASGDVVAFIDDDAVPEPEWLSQIAPAFADPAVAGVGGVTYDHTGCNFQARFILCDRFGDAEHFEIDPGIANHNVPFGPRFPSLMGTNSAFRRSALTGIGGFDEEFDYYLDETDVCARIVDDGWRIVELPGAAVHHKFLPSHLRNEHRVLSTPFPVLKNKVYFAVVQGVIHNPMGPVTRNIERFFGERRYDIVQALPSGRVAHDALDSFDEAAERAWRVGLAQALSGRRRTRNPAWFGAGEPFLPFPILQPEGGRRTFVFLSQAYPPEPMAGNARHTDAIARAIAAQGHQVHVLTRGRDFDRVDLEAGVWVHRIVPRAHPPRRLPDGQAIPRHIWDYSATMLDEAVRIAATRRIDAVEGVSWDCETAAFVLDGRFPVATNLVTGLAQWLETHPEKGADPAWMSEFGAPMLALERIVYERSDRIIAASEAIIDSLRLRHSEGVHADRIVRAPHGLDDIHAMTAIAPPGLDAPGPGRTVVLFVGRLELRKGIDTLLGAAAQLLEARDDLEFWIAGDDTLEIRDGITARQAFLASAGAAGQSDRVRFLGPVSDPELRWLYTHCDIFAAPSRFESFGLVFVEAMIFAKPVIACRAGAPRGG